MSEAFTVVDVLMDHALCVTCIALKTNLTPARVEEVLAELARHFPLKRGGTCDACLKSTGTFRLG